MSALRTALAFTGTVLLLGTTLTAQTVKTIVNNGSSANRYDIVILGDGYQASEQSRFDSDCLAVVGKLFATEPYKSYALYFNVHTVFRASKDSGADHPDVSPPIVKDTVYDASYNTGGTPRCLYIKNTSQALRDAALAPAAEGRVMVVVNDSRYGGCAGQFAVTYNGSSMTEVQAHEFGHSFAGLADEYDYPNNTYTGPEPAARNITADPTGKAKWPLWLGTSGVSAYEGAGYYLKGLFRPKSNCLMRNLGQPLCPVCGEQIVLSAYATVTPIDNPLPTASTLSADRGVKLGFSFTNLVPVSGNGLVTWKIDGTPQSSSGNQLTVDTGTLAYGIHKIEVEVLDRTPFVRNDPNGLPRKTRTWTLNVSTQLPDLSAFYLQTYPATAGGNTSIVTVVQNLGPVSSPAVQVEHFLSVDKVISPDDIYLGGITQPPIAPNAVVAPNRDPVRIPAHVAPGVYNLGVVIDRADAVKEIDETNNVLWIPLAISKAGCIADLGYADQVYPPKANTLVGKTGGSVHPTVTAPCNAGDTYAILLGCTGTTPGTPLGGLNLPLNVDACTRVFFAASLGSTLVTGFVGTLDSGGYGRGAINLPPAVATGTLTGHFAAVVIDRTTGAFVRVTDAVQFTFQ
ncbi:MAG: hypothetical protein H6837_03545 [Planctomycetes bacterium]|nr:hypothetical protein [Planctomycetota bacterium]